MGVRRSTYVCVKKCKFKVNAFFSLDEEKQFCKAFASEDSD